MKIANLVICILLLPLCAVSQETSPRSVLSRVVDEITAVRLDNGMRVLLYPRGSAPVFSGAIGVRVGGTDEQIGQTGISHMFEHMAFKGTESLGTYDYVAEKKLLDQLELLVKEQESKGQPYSNASAPPEVLQKWQSIHTELAKLWNRDAFTREVQKRGGSEMNASTDKELTRYYMSLPRSSFEFWCWIESERLLRPVMREFYQERDVVLEEKRMRYTDSPSGSLYEALLQVAYLSHQYRNPVIGYDHDIGSLTATEVEEFRKTYYVPGNMALAVVGSVDAVRDIEIIKKYFGRIPEGPLPKRLIIDEPKQMGQREFTLRLPAAAQTFIAYHKPSYPDPDDPPISIALEMLSGSRTSPLYTELVDRKRLVVEVGHEEAPGSAFSNLVLFYLTTRNPHTNEEAIKGFDDVLRKFMVHGLTAEALAVAKRRIAVSHLGHLKSNISMAVDLVTSELIYNDWRAFIDWYDKAMAVDLSDIQRVLSKFLRPSNRTIAKLETASGSEMLGENLHVAH